MRFIDEINNFIHSSEIRERFLNPKIFIIPLLFFLFGFITASIQIFQFPLLILLFEWLVLYLIIVLEKLQMIIQ
ncbi:MAG: hypothetical protein ACW97X_07540, partial [Candidatus Hodarchaeales archaeon]